INSLRLCTGTFATEAKSIQKGVYVGRTLLPAAHHDIAVRVINTTSEPILVRKDTYLGVLTPVCTVDNIDDSVDIPPDNPSTEPASQLLINALPSELSDKQTQQATYLIRSYADVFSQGEYDIDR